MKEANAKANSLPGGRTALKAVTMLHRKPAVAAAMKRPAAKKSLAADGLGMTHGVGGIWEGQDVQEREKELHPDVE